MKKVISILLIGTAFIYGCKKESFIIPKIITTPLQPTTLDTICHVALAEAEIDPNMRTSDYTWKVVDGTNKRVDILRVNKDSMWWVPQEEGDYRIEVEIGSRKKTRSIEFFRIKNGILYYKKRIVGKWRGVTTNPWTDPYAVEISFFEDKHYSARTIDGAPHSALYWGEDEDSPSKIYSINAVSSDGRSGGGSINLVWTTTNSISYDFISNVKFPSSDSLYFDITYRYTYGPVKYYLKKF